MEKTKLVAHTASLNKNLSYYLLKFEKNQQWADVAPLLMKIEQLLKNYPSPYITDKVQFAKRLAQCLNPQLTTPIHQSVLRIYDQIFLNLRNYNTETKTEQVRQVLEDIAIFSVGLFTFFQHASQKVRPQFLDLFITHLLPLKRELVPMLPGLVTSILPGLDDQSEAIQKQVWNTLEQTQKAVGRRYMMGAIWMAILRVSRCRSSGIKFLQKSIPKMAPDEDEEEDEFDDSDGYYSDEEEQKKQDLPQESQSSPTKQLSLQQTEDLDIDDAKTFNEKEEQVAQAQIVQQQHHEDTDQFRLSVLRELEQNIDDESDENIFPNKSSLVLNAVLSCLEDENQLIKRNMLDFLYSHLKVTRDCCLNQQDKLVLVEAVLVLLIRKDLSVTRRVNQWLFGKPDMDNKYPITSKNQPVLELVVHGLKKIFEIVPTDLQSSMFPIKLFQNFYMEHDHMLEWIISSIASSLIKYLKTYSEGYSFSPDVLKAGKRLIESVASHLMSVIQALTGNLLDQLEVNIQLEIIDLIDFFFSNLLSSDFHPSVLYQLTRVSVANLIQAFSFQTTKDVNLQTKTMYLALKLLTALDPVPAEIINNGISEDQFTYSLQSFEKVYQQLASNVTEQESSQTLFKYASKVVVKGQRLRQNKRVDKLPEWFVCTTHTIRDGNPSVSLLAIESMIEVLVSHTIDPIYASLRSMVIEESKSRVLQTQTVQGFDYTKLTLENLWCLLDYQFFHDRIIILIVSLSKVFPQLFTEVVVNSFNQSLITEKEAAIRRFAVFWKLTAQYYKSQQSTKELQELNKVGLFLMLDFLDHDNPMIRHVAKNWLLESMPLLHRILDPLFEVLVQPSSVFYVTDRQQVFFSKAYDTRRIHESIKKFKSMLLTYSAPFLAYLMNVELSDTAKDLRLHFTQENTAVVTVPNELLSPPSPQLNQQSLSILQQPMKYLDFLVVVCLKYVQGQAIESLSLRFKAENTSVNASACEFLELLVSNLDHAAVSLRMTDFIVPPLQIVLLHSVENSDFVMQVQLLNLFRIVFFNSAFRRLPNPKLLPQIQQTMTSTVSNDIFIPTLIQGMSTTVLYARAQYISFISSCLPLLAEYLSFQTLTSCVKSVLAAYFQIIKSIADRANENTQKELDTFEYLQGSSQHEISSVLNGVKTILKHIMGLEERDDILYDKQQQGPSVGGYIFSVLTLGMVGGESSKRDIKAPVFAKYQQTCEQIMLTLPSILELYIRCWECNEDFLPFADTLSGLGCGMYSFERYNTYNKILQELLRFTASQPKDLLRPQVLLMMKPLFMSYSRQFMNGLVNLWARECKEASKGHATSDVLINTKKLQQNTFLIKTTEILVMMNCPNDLLIDSLLECDIFKDSIKYSTEQSKKKKQTAFVLNFEIAEKESAIIYFLYNYFKYVYIDPASLRREYLVQFWSSVMNFFKALQPSKAPSTSAWLIELLLLLCKKYSPKEIVSEQARIRNDLHEFINDKLKYLASVSAKNTQFFWTDPSQNNALKQDKGGKFRIVFPISPSIFELYVSVADMSSGKIPESINETDKQILQFMSSSLDADVYTKYRFICLKTLKNIGLELLQSAYSLDRTERVVIRTKEFMDILFPILNDKQPQNQLYVQAVSEVLHYQLDKARSLLIKAYRQQILEVFNKEDFFIMNKRTLRIWENIINWVVQLEKGGDLFIEYLEQVTLHSSFLFGNELKENKLRIKSFERVCFVIFSGERDRYTTKLSALIERISDVIKNDNVHPSLLILVLFCVRILILRLSPLQLSNLFRNIWPMLLTLLINLFTKKPANPQLSQNSVPMSKNLNLVLAGLKLIEMISIMQQDEFYLNMWVFMFDYFGLKIEQVSEISDKDSISPFLYQPYVSGFLKPQKYQIMYKNSQTFVQEDCQKTQREVAIKQVKVDSEEELEECSLKLCQYLIQMNETRSQIPPEKVEELIENDFIQMDEFIFKI